jgi:hypothetical protein
VVKKIDCEDAVVGALGPCAGDSPPLLSTTTGPAQRCQVTGCGVALCTCGGDCILGYYSDYVFLKNDRGSQIYKCT